LENTKAVTQDYFVDLNVGRGTDRGVQLGLDIENAISTVPNVGGISEDEMSMHRIVGTPSLYKIVTLTSSSSGTIPINSDITGNYSVDIYPLFTYCVCDYFINAFHLFKGSIKLKLYITASIFHNVRLKISFDPRDGSTPAPETLYSRIVDISGDTTVDMLIPWYSTRSMKLFNIIDGKHSMGTLHYEVLAWSTPDSTLSTPIYVNIYKAYCSDAQVAGLRSFGYSDVASIIPFVNAQSDPRIDFSLDFEPIHESCSGLNVEKLNAGEEIVNLREILHKYFPRNTYPIDAGNALVRVPGSSIYNQGCPSAANTNLSYRLNTQNEYFMNLFRFWRGSLRYKCFLPDAQSASIVALPFYWNVMKAADPTPLLNPGFSAYVMPSVVASVPGFKKLLEFIIPWYSENFFVSTINYSAACTISGGNSSHPVVFNAFGDDTSFHFIKGPRPIVLDVGYRNYALPASVPGTDAPTIGSEPQQYLSGM
jgi:hypothetical protein